MTRVAPLVAMAVLVATAAAAEDQSSEADLAAALAEANRLYDTSSFPASSRGFEDAICRAQALGDRASLAKAWGGLGRAQWAVGENAKSIESEERALALSRGVADPDQEALLLNNVGLALYSTARHAEALDYYTLALDRAASGAMRALVLLNMGLVFRYQGRFEDSAVALQEALALRRAEGKPRPTALTLNALGMLSRVTGNYARALDCYEEALALRRQAEDRFGEAQTLNNTAVLYGDQGENEKALAIHRQTLRLALDIGYTRQIGLSHENIAAMLDDLGRPRDALAEACAAIAFYRRTGDRSNLAGTLSSAGGYLAELGELEEARAISTEALALALEIGEPETEIASLQSLAETDLEQGRPADALALLDASVSSAESSGFSDLEWKCRLDRARANRLLGRPEESIADLQAAAATVNAIRARVGTDAGKIGFLDRSQEVFEDLVVALAEAHRDQEALETAEAARARALADLLSQRSVSGKAADRAALAEVRGAQARARGSAARGGEVAAALGRLREMDPQLAGLYSVESARLEEIHRIAARLDATLVEYFTARNACYAWVVTPEGSLHATRLVIDRARLARDVRQIRDRLESIAPASREAAALERQMRSLDALLIAPLAPWLPAKPDKLVIILPHGPLAFVPFAALTDASGRPLAARHTLAFSPAMSVFRYTQADGSRPGAAPGLVVADPTPPAGSGLISLPGSRHEAELVAARLGRRTVVLTGAGASEAAFKRAAPEAAVLHLATHGLISEDQPLASSLLLGQGEGEDGYLRVDEITGLDLHADLVVLSGCRTGLGRLSGDGILGLTRAFLYAGARSVVVSQWDVSDQATAGFMDRFYAQLAAGRGKAAALAHAQREAWRRGEPPSLWAAFILVGEPR